MLQFTVIAGPNGAGKSTFSAELSKKGAFVFDPDKEKSLIEKKYPDISEEALESAVTDQYHRVELRAIAGKKDFTVETNLRNEFLAERAEVFSEANYQTRLVFMLLPDIASSMDRVNLRVKKKGHFVDAQSIRYNFEISLANLIKVAPKFDQVMLISAASGYEFKYQPELLLTIKSDGRQNRSDQIPEWALPMVEKVINAVSGHDQQRNIQRLGPKR